MTAQTGRSLKLSVEELEKANTALSKLGSKTDLAASLPMSRTTINKFFKGEPVQRKQFHAICEKLKLDWQPPAIEKPQSDSFDVDAIVQTIREQIKPIVRQKCGTMRVLDMEQPIELTGERGIYTNVNILERITGRNRLEIAEILRNCGVEEFERAGLSQVTEKRVPGLEAVEQHRKLMVLGKPGAGKSTFLKYLAMQCIEGNFRANRIPVFITLKDFAEIKGNPNLFSYIGQLVELPTSDDLRNILQQGQLLVLLDGLDEVREEDTKRVLRQILEFSDQFHLNQFVMTCRIAAKEYTFERFTEVEVADFDKEQIAIFTQNWFRLSDPAKAERFIQKLEENEPIQELASSPLLLTLLCLVFGESADFPANRSELYKEGLDILLKKWDGKRNIEREQLYKNLSLKRKEDLLSQIALTTFEQKDYFFKQKTLEAYISDFIRNLPNIDSDPEILRMDSEAVLKSIEAQHGLFVERAKGIYSFSHLTFQEYFSAKEIVANSAYKNLIKHLTEKRWREVFLLAASMMRNADALLMMMKAQIDSLVTVNDNLQQLLSWIHEKSCSTNVQCKAVAIRLFYLELVYDHGSITYFPSGDLENKVRLAKYFDETLNLIHKFNSDHNKYHHTARERHTLIQQKMSSIHQIVPGLIVDHALDHALRIALLLTNNLAHIRSDSFYMALDDCLYYQIALVGNIDSSLKKVIPSLRSKTKNTSTHGRITLVFQKWWQENGQAWTEKLRAVMVEHRNIGHDWQFSSEQKQLLQQYYNANKLLVDCLNSDCYVSRDVRQEIEDTLLLPISGIVRAKYRQPD